jgi:hypothetical protein
MSQIPGGVFGSDQWSGASAPSSITANNGRNHKRQKTKAAAAEMPNLPASIGCPRRSVAHLLQRSGDLFIE